MKLVVMLMLGLTFGANASGLAQKITLSVKDVPLEELFTEIRKQTDYEFLYSDEMLKQVPRVTLRVKNAGIDEVMGKCLQGHALTWRTIAGTVTLIPLPDRTVQQDMGAGNPEPPGLEKVQLSVAGTVRDTTGEPLTGVSVTLKSDPSIGTSTDLDGRYSLQVPEDGVLVFSFLGFQPREVPVNGQEVIDAVLKVEDTMLDELVVVGYGSQKKVNLTGSVDVVSGEQLHNRAATNVADLIKGTSPNLNINMNFRGGEPGATSSWNIRGMGSVQGNSAPLILVDGVEMDINNVDPESIESVSVLKDASASAVYGSRAPFGVILITTKQGQQGDRMQIQYNNNVSASSPIRVPSYVDALTWTTAYNQANANAGLAPIYSNEQIERIRGYMDGTFPYEYDPDNPIDNIWGGRRDGNANYDWPRLMLKDFSFSQKHNINVSGGGEKTQYYLAGGYVDQEGMYEHGYDFYKRYNFLTNFSSEITPWFNFRSSLKYAKSRADYPVGQTTVGREHFFKEIITFAPMMPQYNINGTIQSPLIRLMQDAGREVREVDDFFITLGGDIEPVEGWKTTFSYNYNLISSDSSANPRPVWVEVGTGDLGNVGKPASGHDSRFARNEYTLINATTSYERNLDDHFLKLLLGFEQEERRYGDLQGTGQNLIVDNIPSISTSLGATTLDDRIYHWATRGFFTRFNYNYQEKYLLEVSARYNGSSRFAKGRRWGFFPAASAGYNISREPFWAGIEPYVNSLKIRGSYGSLGNQNVANYLHLPTIPVSNEAGWIIDGARPPVARVPGLISEDLTWETITTLNLGLDAGFLDNRLEVVFDWYNRVTTDMLGPAETLPYLLGTSTPLRNNAEMSTKGFELALSWNDQVSDHFSYNARINIGDARSRILRYRNDDGLVNTWYDGKDVGEMWGLTTGGIIQSADEEIPDQSRYHANWGPGDIRYVDLNGDGVVNDGSRTLDDHGDLSVIGNSTARYNIGITAGFNWKNFDFSMFWQGIGKRDYHPHLTSPVFWGMISSWGSSGLFRNSPNLDYWRPADETNMLGPNTDAYFAKPYFTAETNKNRQVQSRYVLNASYLRLKNLQIGYRLPQHVLNRIFLESARIFISGENLVTLTSLPRTMDPETIIASDPNFDGYFGGGVIYPLSRFFSLGLNVTF